MLVITSIVIFNCEGRKTQSQALKESLEAYKIKTIVTEDTYVPELYSEVKIDSTLTNGFYVSVKNYTNMHQAYTISKRKNNILTYTHFRSWISDLKVTFNNQDIVNTLIDDDFIDNITNTHEYSSFRYSHLEVLQEKTASDSIRLNVYALKPQTKDFLVYELEILSNGTIKLQDITLI
ncbi:hypothetical protein RM697_09520 [Ichthyenterobacterium sp. W332]|uniref:Uncharacterized protein n=1 Tax=Microcosmobacter mediterraneus TaxID=3075607 RepID=A0ABU2YM29_9FLAO|nr:hypothetical protein [Ichthyenterobacterium sp. W332]MDT0558887.1 hypothetical protein [Ichthyenterobacterium sp. W332]